jgi:hypothetical protein
MVVRIYPGAVLVAVGCLIVITIAVGHIAGWW